MGVGGKVLLITAVREKKLLAWQQGRDADDGVVLMPFYNCCLLACLFFIHAHHITWYSTKTRCHACFFVLFTLLNEAWTRTEGRLPSWNSSFRDLFILLATTWTGCSQTRPDRAGFVTYEWGTGDSFVRDSINENIVLRLALMIDWLIRFDWFSIHSFWWLIDWWLIHSFVDSRFKENLWK